MRDEIGIDRDVVTLTLDGREVVAVSEYDVQMNVLTIPSVFALTMGHGGDLVELIEKTAPNTPFELAVDGRTQFSGKIDGHRSRGTATEGSAVTVRGRDRLAALHDAFVEHEESFSNVTYVELLRAGLKAAMPGQTIQIGFDNNANRLAVSGATKHTSSKSTSRRSTTLVYETEGGAESAAGQRIIQAKLGMRWYDGLLKPEFERAGLFVSVLADGTFGLTTPDTSQAAMYRLTRKLDNPRASNIQSHDFSHDTTPRFAAVEVHFRSGGGAETRTRAFGFSTDAEMADHGFTKKCVIQDHRCKNLVQADFLAKRKLAESRRHGWSLVYTVPGHTTIGLDGQRLGWAIDTTVDVDDEILGVHTKMYVEGVRFLGAPHRSTELHLMRLGDLLFADPENGLQGTTEE